MVTTKQKAILDTQKRKERIKAYYYGKSLIHKGR